MKKTLIILAHPNMPQSRLNKTLIDAVKTNPMSRFMICTQSIKTQFP